MTTEEAIARIEKLLDKCWTGAAVVVGENFKALGVAISALREVDTMRAYLEEHSACDSCRHVNEHEAACNEADCECSQCGMDCACKDCWSANGWKNWEWKGGS